MMKKILFLAIAIMLVVTGSAMATVVASKHDLSSNGVDSFTDGATTQICVFCHTPHSANTLVIGLLWNRSAPSGAYSTYVNTVSNTFDAPDVGTISATSISGLCLSCHDSTVSTLNVLINAPNDGFGGGFTNGTDLGGRASDLTNAGSDDLVNDHPVNFDYVNMTDLDGNNFPTAVSNVVTGILSSLPYPLDGNGYMQCSTCHDPHLGAADSQTANIDFMNGNMANSQMCIDCHTDK